MQTRIKHGAGSFLLLACCVCASGVHAGEPAPAAPANGAPAADAKAAAPVIKPDPAALRAIEKGKDCLLAKDYENGVKILEGVVEKYPENPARFLANLELARHFSAMSKFNEALNALRTITELEHPGQELPLELKDTVLEGLYLTGAACFNLHLYDRAFPVLRKITNDYPNSVWANQAYYYIGLCHFSQGSWKKSIEALSLVGTFVDSDTPTEYVEAGQRFYVKIVDADLPVLKNMGGTFEVELSTQSGDKEKISCIPLAGKGDVFIGSIPSAIAPAVPGDKVLQVLGGDVITVKYTDSNTKDGQKDVVRESKVKVVSSGQVIFSLATFEGETSAAFLGQPLHILVLDADKDTTPQADTLEVKLISRFKVDDPDDDESITGGGEKKREAPGSAGRGYKLRDELTLKLTELGTAPVRTGRFGGSVPIVAYTEGKPVVRGSGTLTCALGDEIICTYIDELHIGGANAHEVVSRIMVAGEIENRPRATQYLVVDPVLRAKKEVVEATAFLELARIFKSMGLNDGAKAKAVEGMDLVDRIVRSQSTPASMKEKALALKWDLQIVQDDLRGALDTCQLFSRLFPNSPAVDQALMGMGQIKSESKSYYEAIEVYKRVLALPQSQAKAEAQFRIAETTEASIAAQNINGNAEANSDVAVEQYKLCAERFPESEFAGKSLAKVVDYYTKTRDFGPAEELLEHIFKDYPDGKFLDAMLMKWIAVAVARGDYQKAHQKCSQLVFEYPSSPHAEDAKKLLPKIEQRLKQQ